MKKFVFLFACVATLGVASALNCYACNGATCEKESKAWQTNRCGETQASLNSQGGKDHIPVCVKTTYKDRSTSKTMVERRCVIAESKNGKPDHHCNVANGDVTDCQQCTTDLCNSATSLRFNLFAISSIIVALVAPKFF